MTNNAVEDKIKILRIIARLNIGGPAIHTVLLTRYMADRGYDTLLAVGQVGPEEGDMSYLAEAEGVKSLMVSQMGRRVQPLRDLLSFVRLLRLFGTVQPDIVHTHTAKAGALGRLAALVYNTVQSVKSGMARLLRKTYPENVSNVKNGLSTTRCKIVHTFHGHVLNRYFSLPKSKLFLAIERILARCTDFIVVLSEQQKDELCNKYGIGRPEQYRIIPLGFDLATFHQTKRREGEFRERFGLPEREGKLVGIIGRLTPIKNHRVFLEAARVLVQACGLDHIRFLIAGDGELRNELEILTHHLAMADRVLFTGWLKDLAPLYADLDVLALTSDNEGTPVAVIEAMAASVPVVATDVGGVRELVSERGRRKVEIQEGEFEICERGLLAKAGDVAGFAKGLGYLLAHPSVCRVMGKRGREYVLNQHGKERLIQDMDSLYRSML
ncbi:MAG: glycosyltransferase [Deltaproteobacteria bacterium]|nr:MAG: glycosyltransferase [Deltaproteobacteria bacterium]